MKAVIRMMVVAVVVGGMSASFATTARAQVKATVEGPTLSLGQLILRENFDDNAKNALWRVCADDADNCWVLETNYRLEVRSRAVDTEAQALYLANAWRFDPNADFSMKVDLQYTPVTYAKGWVGFGLTPNGINPLEQQIGIGIGAANLYPHYWYRRVEGISTTSGSAPRFANIVTLYISYRASADEVYISDSGYGPENAWTTFPGVVRGEWGGKPLYLWLGGGAGGLTLASGQAALDNLLVESGSVIEASVCDVYRFWSPTLRRHFYTIDEAEKEILLTDYSHVWTYEGPVFGAFRDDSDPACRPVYRFWSDRLSGHFYTIDEQEKDQLLESQRDMWTFEGVVFYAYPEGLQPAWAYPVYRFWAAANNAHFFTMSESEKDNLIANHANTWAFEGIAWYALK